MAFLIFLMDVIFCAYLKKYEFFCKYLIISLYIFYFPIVLVQNYPLFKSFLQSTFGKLFLIMLTVFVEILSFAFATHAIQHITGESPLSFPVFFSILIVVYSIMFYPAVFSFLTYIPILIVLGFIDIVKNSFGRKRTVNLIEIFTKTFRGIIIFIANIIVPISTVLLIMMIMENYVLAKENMEKAIVITDFSNKLHCVIPANSKAVLLSEQTILVAEQNEKKDQYKFYRAACEEVKT